MKNNDVEGLKEEKKTKCYKKIIGLGLILTLIKVKNIFRANQDFHIISYFYSTTKHEIIQIKKSQFTM